MKHNKDSPRTRIGVVIIKNDQLLLVRHKKNDKKYWLLPGGGVEYGESIYECAIREVLEETGLKVEIDKILFINESIAPDKSRHIINIYVSAYITGGELRKGDEEILDGLEFIDFDKIEDMTIYPPIGEHLMNFKKNNYELKGGISYLGQIWQI